MKDLLKMLSANFEGLEKQRLLFVNKTPKYGNDNDEADDIMRWVFDEFYSVVNGRTNTKGGVYRINMLPTTSHVYFGSVINAMPEFESLSLLHVSYLLSITYYLIFFSSPRAV